jgi:hypothetical protein
MIWSSFHSGSCMCRPTGSRPSSQHTYFIEAGLLGMDASLIGAALRAEHLWLIY